MTAVAVLHTGQAAPLDVRWPRTGAVHLAMLHFVSEDASTRRFKNDGNGAQRFQDSGIGLAREAVSNLGHAARWKIEDPCAEGATGERSE